MVLTHQSVLGFGKNAHQIGFVQFVHMGDDRDTAHKFGDKAEFNQILRVDAVEQLTQGQILAGTHLGAKAHGSAAHATAHDLVEAHKGAAHDEQNVARVHADKFLLGVLAPALGRNIGLCAFNDLEQGLLHAFARNVAGDRGAIALARNLVDFVNVDDALAGGFEVVVCILQQLHKDVFHILTHVASFCQCGGIGYGKGHAQHTSQSFGKQGFTAARGAHKQDVAFFKLHIVAQSAGVKHALVVVVHRHRKNFFGLVLPDNVLIKAVLDLLGRKKAFFTLRAFHLVAGDNFVAGFDALVANACAVLHDEIANLKLAASAKGAAQGFAHRGFIVLGHIIRSFPEPSRSATQARGQ